MTATPRQQEADTALIKALEFWQAQGFTPSEMHDAMSRHIAITDKMNGELQEFAYRAANGKEYSARELHKIACELPLSFSWSSDRRKPRAIEGDRWTASEVQEFVSAQSTPYYMGSDESFLPLYSLQLEPDSELPDQGAIKAFIRGAKAWLMS